MKIKKLLLNNFGPFRNYEFDFPNEPNISLLLTGKNNEGKSTILNSIKLLNYATKVVDKTRQSFWLDGDLYYHLYKQDIEDLLIGRMIFNYRSTIATIKGLFSNKLTLTVYINAELNDIYCSISGRSPKNFSNAIGFIPPLGQIAETEKLISNIDYLKKSLNTTLAPRHLRNHFYHFLSSDEYKLVQQIINDTWKGIELLDFELDITTRQLNCFYKEDRIEREISWAGQGLQVWFQIVTHLVRLKKSLILILDEPEIFLHPQKQNDLIRILSEYYNGSFLIATHSIELMNNVDISHIINVKKSQDKPKIKRATDRLFLELIRSQVGSNFNFVASQFEDVDILLFTEDIDDFKIINRIAKNLNINKSVYNIPVHGFHEYKKSIYYKEAYQSFFGKEIKCTIVLDRDYYPDKYLKKIKIELSKFNIKTVFTIGKEIENILLNEAILLSLIPKERIEEFETFINHLFETEYDDCWGSLLSLHTKFFDKGTDIKTIVKLFHKNFDLKYKDKQDRYNMIAGKNALKKIRKYFKDQFDRNLPTSFLVDEISKNANTELESFINEIYQLQFNTIQKSNPQSTLRLKREA